MFRQFRPGQVLLIAPRTTRWHPHEGPAGASGCQLRNEENGVPCRDRIGPGACWCSILPFLQNQRALIAVQYVTWFEREFAGNTQDINSTRDGINIDKSNSSGGSFDALDQRLIGIHDDNCGMIRTAMVCGKYQRRDFVLGHAVNLFEHQSHLMRAWIADYKRDWLAIGPTAGLSFTDFQQISQRNIFNRVTLIS